MHMLDSRSSRTKNKDQGAKNKNNFIAILGIIYIHTFNSLFLRFMNNKTKELAMLFNYHGKQMKKKSEKQNRDHTLSFL